MHVFILLSLVLASALAASLSPEQRIVGGQLAYISQYPSLASLMQSFEGTVFIHICAGTIINSRNILTTASCLPSDVSKIRARIGSTYASYGGTILFIDSMIIHGSYNPITYENDIGLARTDQSISFVINNVMPATYATDASTNVPADGSVVRIVGWGRTEVAHYSNQMRDAKVQVLNSLMCQYLTGAQALVPTTMFCTSSSGVHGSDVCQGDNGSPIFLDNVVVGIVSRPGCGDYFKPSLSTRVSMFGSFISEHS